ncbi:MAG: tetratricopeptide repeat protein, partial [Bacteroidales bacterium]|nr:tetratricopeptide repeat protein [Bacteroidales bacterium]
MKSRIVILLAVMTMMAVPRHLQAQSKYGEDSARCVLNISLFREEVKKKNYEKAYPYWKAVLDSCPMSTKNVFVNGVPILEYKIKQAQAAKDTPLMEKYVQDLFDMLDLRRQCYPADEGYVLGQKGYYLTKFRLKTDYEEAYEDLRKAVALSTSATLTAQVLDTYFKVAEYYMKRKAVNGVMDTTIMINAYDEITEVLDDAVEVREEEFQKVMEKIFLLREQLDSQKIEQNFYDDRYGDLQQDSAKAFVKYNSFQKVANNIDIVFSKYANCEVLTEIYGKKLEQSKDEKLLRQVIKLFNKKECTNNPTYVTAVKEFHQISPTAQTAYYMGVISQKEGAYTEAMDYFNQALSMYQKQSDTIRTYLKIAEVLFGQKQYSAAREYAHKVLRMNPTNAEAYIFIGNLYALSGCNTEIPGA